MKDELAKMIIEIAGELREEEEIEITDELRADTPLFGEDGMLDSMGLVSLVIAVEQAIEEQFERRVSLADEKALSQANSPYRTVNSLADYAASELAQPAANG